MTKTRQSQSGKTQTAYTFCVAPMMDRTDRFDRYFLRQITRHARLYTEMVTTGAVLHGHVERLIGFDPEERPLALQIGGSNPRDLSACAKIAEQMGYDEVNLNVGCPSDRVLSGQFGACLMATPDVVADCVRAMRESCRLPVTVKCRIGIDDQNPADSLFGFVETVAQAGCDVFLVHGRKAWLTGLSPKENRTIPPLDYPLVYALKRAYPDLTVVINGGIESLGACDEHLKHVDGVMLGRAAYHQPYLLADVDRRYFLSNGRSVSRHDVIENYLPYVERQCASGVPLYAMARHTLGLFHGRPGARAWRSFLSTNAHKPGAHPDLLRQALQLVARDDVSAPA